MQVPVFQVLAFLFWPHIGQNRCFSDVYRPGLLFFGPLMAAVLKFAPTFEHLQTNRFKK